MRGVRSQRDQTRRTGFVLPAVGAIVIGLVGTLAPATSWASSRPAWSAPIRIEPASVAPDNVSVYGLSCATSRMCVATDAAGFALVWSHGRWSRPQEAYRGGTLDSISCPSVSFCIALSSGGTAVTYDGRTWSQPVRVGPSASYEVSCPTTSFCSGVGAPGLAGASSTIAMLEHGTWSSFQTSTTGAVSDRLLGVSCPSATFCVAVNFDGHILTFNGRRWSAGTAAILKGLDSVSCSSGGFCMAVSGSGAYETLEHGSWSRARIIPGFRSQFARSLSCTSSGSCDVFGLAGTVAQWRGGRWSKPLKVFPGGFTGTVTVSCASGRHCAAVNSRGQAAISR